MTAPRIEVDLPKVRANARHLVRRLGRRGIGVTGVMKGVRGHPDIARAMLDGGVTRLGDARLSNVERMREAGIDVPIVLIRTPMLGQADRIVRACGTSLNTDMGVVRALARSAVRAGRVHGIVAMVDLGDGREGLRPGEVVAFARRAMGLHGVALRGIGANFACLSARPPDPAAMEELSVLAAAVEAECGVVLATVSGGNSASLPWALGPRTSTRIDDLRLGEAILLGRDPLSGRPIEGLSTDAFSLVAEVIESAGDAPLLPDRRTARARASTHDRGGRRTILAIGDQDTDIEGLAMPDGVTLLGSTSDHLVVAGSGTALVVGSELHFEPNYSALMRAMSAPDVTTVMRHGACADRPAPDRGRLAALEEA